MLNLRSNIVTVLLIGLIPLHVVHGKTKDFIVSSANYEADVLELLQGQWLCKKTFKGSLGNGLFSEVSMVEYNLIQGNQIFSQSSDYITVTSKQGKKHFIGRAIVVERGQEHIDHITNESYQSRLTRLDDARWINVDDNKMGQFIYNDYFPFLDKLAKKELAEGISRITHIDELTKQQWRYHDDAKVPTYADCYRIENVPLTQ